MLGTKQKVPKILFVLLWSVSAEKVSKTLEYACVYW